MNGKNAWNWYGNFGPKFKIVEYMDVVNDKHITDLYGAYFWIDICVKVEEKVIGLIIVHERTLQVLSWLRLR